MHTKVVRENDTNFEVTKATVDKNNGAITFDRSTIYTEKVKIKICTDETETTCEISNFDFNVTVTNCDWSDAGNLNVPSELSAL